MPDNHIGIRLCEDVEHVVEHFSFPSSGGHLSLIATSLLKVWRELAAERSDDGIRCMIYLFRWCRVVDVVCFPYRGGDCQYFLVVCFMVDNGSYGKTHHSQGWDVLGRRLIGLGERIHVFGIVYFDFQATPRGLGNPKVSLVLD